MAGAPSRPARVAPHRSGASCWCRWATSPSTPSSAPCHAARGLRPLPGLCRRGGRAPLWADAVMMVGTYLWRRGWRRKRLPHARPPRGRVRVPVSPPAQVKNFLLRSEDPWTTRGAAAPLPRAHRRRRGGPATRPGCVGARRHSPASGGCLRCGTAEPSSSLRTAWCGLPGARAQPRQSAAPRRPAPPQTVYRCARPPEPTRTARAARGAPRPAHARGQQAGVRQPARVQPEHYTFPDRPNVAKLAPQSSAWRWPTGTGVRQHPGAAQADPHGHCSPSRASATRGGIGSRCVDTERGCVRLPLWLLEEATGEVWAPGPTRLKPPHETQYTGV